MVGGVQMYDYSVTLPTSFPAQAGVGYWIQIEASQYGYPLTWGNATGAGGNNAHYRRLGNSYYSGTGDLAITLSADVPTSYAIAADASSSARGSVSGAGTFALDAVVNLSATANDGLRLRELDRGRRHRQSPARAIPFPPPRTASLVANFQPTCTLTLTSSSTTMGTVSGGGHLPHRHQRHRHGHAEARLRLPELDRGGTSRQQLRQPTPSHSSPAAPCGRTSPSDSP